ncbi:hypothetical protein DUNSADRAFT_11869 [Dunaliella salina]|uniref:Encoded protein n=1 Tax=Dunaliella salina TaxID=3046 RepID=A0ABQ7H472_DUNSA|nr:hypothetical protein DUNSADRAFT_11869 [Dunaliella salina]|eukprot:KAF5841661.1 hypothetical protein DUNSADRAFT_11869 [Dunaliella salina]
MAKTSHWHWSNSSSMQEASGAGSQRKRDAHAPRCQKAVRQFLKDSRWRKKKYISNIQVTSRRCFNHLYFTPLSLSIRPIWQNLGSVPHKSRCKKEWKQVSGQQDCTTVAQILGSAFSDTLLSLACLQIMQRALKGAIQQGGGMPCAWCTCAGLLLAQQRGRSAHSSVRNTT